MKIGFCVNHKNTDALETLSKEGADFCEFAFNSFENETTDYIKSLKSRLDALNLKCLSYNCMLSRGGSLITGNDKNWEALKSYLEPLFDKLSALGRRLVIFGSSFARERRENQTDEQAKAEIAGFMGEIVVPLLEKYDWICAVEPLSECNIIRSTYDGLEIVKRTNSDRVKLLADIYHMSALGQSPQDLLDCKGLLAHTHIASKAGRKFPHLSDEDDYGAYFDALRSIGYDDCVSVEGGTVDGETYTQNVAAALKTLRKFA